MRNCRQFYSTLSSVSIFYCRPIKFGVVILDEF